ncbi:SET domain-containing protein-lysine N-methyltransferase [Sediminibacterium roseum]|uniref:SET domain-containing protein-lysine N-methyltransferase n=1 Tax=Sediminibacterium roseum TaxID=1978412 RepID=A0ABW9ZY75_9BACT|nr:SET domain-containing protein-lysine N-methyltransferase [Sediminibacterium roseum]NCI52124.1 SET domain-containing protein-lysine N-methyltransferase [Sediminibacterium roseum]
MKICVLQPDYSTSGEDYKNYDPPRDLSHLLPGDEVDHVFLNKLTTYKQLKALQYKGYDIFINLCEGYLEWEVPSIDVIYTLELLNLPFTGPTTLLYDPPKDLMKYVAYCENVLAPAYVIIEKEEDAVTACEQLRFPLFVKPSKAGDSLGVDEGSLVHNKEQLLQKIRKTLRDYPQLLAEEYIEGREFTVLIAANADGKTATTFKPVEYVFPKGFSFKTYALKTSELHPDANIPCNDPIIEAQLRDAAQRIFKGFNGVGYGRLDFRLDAKGQLYFLEINFTCSVFYPEGSEGSADHILRFDGTGAAAFLRRMIEEGLARYKRSQKKYLVKGNAIAGYGICATVPLKPGETVFTGEGRPQRIVTKRHVEENWSEDDKLVFRRYAYPLSDAVFLLWDHNPSEWAPQNHCCEPNTAYDGLNVVALKHIRAGEELTLDYASFLDENMEPFHCSCKAINCRGEIRGKTKNSVTLRENNP